ncbi:ribosomal protein L18e/L15P [Ochromonadaceae sp. CCMP2298]|nr:ribosomal protein L18e/L15P [Ochromonadaceae sp. CCMP2298]|mmetsp:Transcript_14874/g.32826  ORF Transcript_14874/g.32826 Transcript_14874/m.32826 type:complete len:286 (-) Transcript_14874:215-1072(-)|eukprot:CAMPEP_0173188518 /NCGR_PEP_ID=MMETSP1141-20130122/11297_1 /TAXON_ID=483371 /ORGANISM="non described non described, Strain CCMP2298" /LENGTH=285 /DNA_ID=CAMNT_0014112451 /DNA_START=121 /DNA_END=978 /DNA_ORIENTATION=-
MLRAFTQFKTQVKSSVFTHVEAFSTQAHKILALNDLRAIEGSVKKRKRWGRGVGSGRGKLCGYGHQKSLSTNRAFEGGQTPLYKRLPKIGFHNHGRKDLQILNLCKVQQFIDMGRLVPKNNAMVTMRELYAVGLVSQVREGIKLLAKGKDELRTPVHFEVSAASVGAIEAVQSAGGTVTCVHFNRLALRALVKPLKFELLPRRARPPPGTMDFYLDRTKAGYLSPEVQMRNLKLFGHVTSEMPMRAEHDRYMEGFRRGFRRLREERRALLADSPYPAGKAAAVPE